MNVMSITFRDGLSKEFSKKLSKEAITDITLTLMSEMTHIDAGV